MNKTPRVSGSVTGSAHNYSLLTSFIVIVMLGGMFGWFMLSRNSNKTDIRMGGHVLQVDIADDNAERIQGLSGRETLEPRTGMLFVFEEGENTCIWMKDMKFPIDIMWINSDGLLTDMRRNVSPETYPDSFCPATPAKYVLELPAGSADNLGFQPRITELEAVAF